MAFSLIFHDLDQTQAQATFKPFIDLVTSAPQDYDHRWDLPPGRTGAALVESRVPQDLRATIIS